MNLTFLGWDRPVLHTAVDYLLHRFSVGTRLDMGGVLCVLPGGRAGRRLEEVLLECVEERINAGKLDPDWTPPRILTLGQLPEELYPLKRPRADELTQLFAWIAVLHDLLNTEGDLLKRLLPEPPNTDDWEAWWELAKMFARMHRELAAEDLDCMNVARLCRDLGVFGEEKRWEVLAELEKRYLARLDELKLWDIQTARLEAVRREEPIKEPPHRKEIVLVGTVDLNRAQRQLLEMVRERVSVLVFAPDEPSFHKLFDSYGCVDATAWSEREIDIPEHIVRSVAGPAEQAVAVLEWLAPLEKPAENTAGHATGKYAPDEITLGVADESVAPLLREQLAQCDLKARYGAGIKMETTSVYRLIEAFGRFLNGRRFEDLASLLRHPALGTMSVEPFCQAMSVEEGGGEHSCDSVKPTPKQESEADRASDRRYPDAIMQLDRYRATFLQVYVPRGADSPEWKTIIPEIDSRNPCDFLLLRNTVATLDAHCGGMLDTDGQGRPVRRLPGAWCPMVRAFLDALLSEPSQPGPSRRGDRLVREGYIAAEKTLDRIDALPEDISVPITATQMIALLLNLLKPRRIPPEVDREAIEMLGWLELAMDDAPVMGVTGMNEGVLSPTHSSDMFLPNRIRERLKLEDNGRRYARDAYSLSVILNSRSIGKHARESSAAHAGPMGSEKVLLVAGRRGADGASLLPSRLFFAADEETLVQRAYDLFRDRKESPPVVFHGPGNAESGASEKSPERKRRTFEPPPLPLADPPRKMGPTEFRDYLACPYRYFLKHRLKLESADDRVEELDGGAFGSLAHDILKDFGRDPRIAAATVSEVIADWLGRRLDALVRERYGATARPAVAIQVEQLRLRLREFAVRQAEWAERGYRIEHVELPFEVPLDVDGEAVILKGRIDRIDYHAQRDEYVLLDYKTGDKGEPPEKTHRIGKHGAKKWVDLQLPLYRYAFGHTLAAKRLAERGKELEVGYVVMPKDTSQTKIILAEWGAAELDEALVVARQVVRDIREGRFDMHPTPPPFSDMFAALCLDRQAKI